MRRVVLAVLALFASIPSFAQLANGDVVGLSRGTSSIGAVPSIVFAVSSQSIAPLGNPQFSEATALAISNGHVYVAAQTRFTELDASLHTVRSVVVPELIFALTADNSRSIHVLGESGTLFIYGADGALQHQIALPGVTFSAVNTQIDLSDNQCTLFYSDAASHIRRYDVCSQSALPDFAEGKSFSTFRVLADGGVAAVTTRDALAIVDFYDPSARLILSATLPASVMPVTIAFDADPAYLWINAATVVKLRIKDAAIVKSTFGNLKALAVVGERRPSTASLVGRRRGARS